jgi:anaerobic magnesium-protoporphyrin IX monomethyl ester cyclase
VGKEVGGLAFRDAGKVHLTPPRPPIANLDEYRIGWELIEDWDRYQCFGVGRAAIIQLSRGCPHRCTYCGQHGFWMRWRYRDPERVAQELEWLRTTHNVRFVTLADENPTTLPEVWEGFLRAVARRNLDMHFFSTMRATDIVRDEAILPLYREAGLLYILMGVDTTEPRLQRKVRKNSTVAADRRAARLLRKHGIFAMLGHIVGFEDDTWRTHWRTLRSLLRYDADFLNAMYVTPHSWTEFAHENAQRGVIQPDLSKWDYRHQVLGQKHLRSWQVFLAVKLTELVFHTRPARWAAFFSGSRFQQRQLLWCLWHTGLVWLGEIGSFLRTRTLPMGQTEPLGRFHARARGTQSQLQGNPARKRAVFQVA